MILERQYGDLPITGIVFSCREQPHRGTHDFEGDFLQVEAAAGKRWSIAADRDHDTGIIFAWLRYIFLVLPVLLETHEATLGSRKEASNDTARDSQRRVAHHIGYTKSPAVVGKRKLHFR